MGITVIIILLLFFTSVLSSQEINLKIIIAAVRELWKVLFLVPSVCVFLYVYEICQEPPKGFAPNSHGRHVWPLAQTSLKVGVKNQGHQGQKMAFSALLVACVQIMFGKTSFASSYYYYYIFYYNS